MKTSLNYKDSNIQEVILSCYYQYEWVKSGVFFADIYGFVYMYKQLNYNDCGCVLL